MKKVVLLSLLLLNLNFLFADNNGNGVSADSKQVATMHGTIVDKSTGEPLAGALVEIEGESMKTYTDFDGNFEFKNLNPGVINVKVSLVSYKENMLKDINVSAGRSSVIEIAIDN